MTKPFNIHDWQAKQRLTEHGGKAFGTDTDNKYDINISNILQLIKSTGIDPMDVMEEIGVEFKINFDFSGGAPGMTRYGSEMPGPGRASGMEEMSTTGTGTSFNPGAGEGYMTPNAFKKKKKK